MKTFKLYIARDQRNRRYCIGDTETSIQRADDSDEGLYADVYFCTSNVVARQLGPMMDDDTVYEVEVKATPTRKMAPPLSSEVDEDGPCDCMDCAEAGVRVTPFMPVWETV